MAPGRPPRRAAGVAAHPCLVSAMASILVFGPHPDDQELGMGGTVAKLVRQGHTVHLVDMTNGEPTPFGSVETRAREAAAAAKVLGVGRISPGSTTAEEANPAGPPHLLSPFPGNREPQFRFSPFPRAPHPNKPPSTRMAKSAAF